jgi:hypothetical protein
MIQNGLVGIALWSSFRHQKWLVAHQWTWTQQTYQVSQLDEAPTNQSTNWPCSLCGHVFFVGYIPWNTVSQEVDIYVKLCCILWHNVQGFSTNTKIIHSAVAFGLLSDVPVILCYSFKTGIWVIQEFWGVFWAFHSTPGVAEKIHNVTTSTDVHNYIHYIRHNRQKSPQPSLSFTSPWFAQLPKPPSDGEPNSIGAPRSEVSKETPKKPQDLINAAGASLLYLLGCGCWWLLIHGNLWPPLAWIYWPLGMTSNDAKLFFHHHN